MTPEAVAAGAATRCPVGDGTNVAVYSFLERELTDAAKVDEGRAHARRMLAEQAELEKQPDMKPMRAALAESEISHALATLCAGTRGCGGVALYTKSGLAIAMSSTDMPLGFEDAQWTKLGKARDGELVDGFLVFHAEHGVALCK